MIGYYVSNRGLHTVAQWEPGCWINVECPGDEDRELLLNRYQVPEAFLNDIEDVDERPRIEEEDGWHLIVIRIPCRNVDSGVPYSTVPLGLIFKDEVVVSVCHFKTDLIDDFILYTKRKAFDIHTRYDLAFRLLLSASVWYQKYLKQVNMRIKEAEKELERSIRNEDLQTLLKLEKSLEFFITSLKGNDILLHKLRNLKSHRDTFDADLVEDVEIELKQAQETTNTYSNILSGMMDAYASVISNNLNVIMKQLTLVSIILMIPTLIASLFGMNVRNGLEEQSWSFGLIIIISVMLSGIGVFLFKRKKWF
ncbi:magnesium transporter [Breznakibacter xylanolyticus]|uniref:Magnesium transporter n=1 Tax=Breznakibacter xylanolyticus TaxID=990 RepID=A0A2W7P1P3_9BACT|nr:magnesium transporter CorA family protein [Breznakibacter xylanolyticus]MBN2743521.1 magnesium transporter CorA family protein [Marinilabiliaceae bacterium]PZX17372.1 magnesium transporter [Breznakibacter xylanolyticus]